MHCKSLIKCVVFAYLVLPMSAYAHCAWNHPGHCVKDVVEAPVKAAEDVAKTAEKAVQDVGKTAEKAAQDIGATAEKAAQDIGSNVEKGVQDVGKTGEKAVQDVGKNAEKGIQDIARALDKAGKDTEAETARAGKNVEEAVAASGRYLERQAQGVGNTLSDAEIRLREGKVIDAIWHSAIDPIKYTEKNASQAALESSIIRTVGQTAATAYGGPGGAAAYAAWLTYRETGDPDLALRVGIITGASSYAFGEVAEMPNSSTEEIAKKAIVAGAIGGTAIAAAGGNEAAIKEGFLKAGAMVVVQDGFKKYTTHDFDPKASNGIAYCMTTNPGVGCQPVPSGAITSVDDKGNITGVDMAKLDPKYSHVGIKSADIGFGNEQLPEMKVVSQIPGMNAMAVFHDTWAMNWKMDSLTTKITIIPAIAITYIGTGAPYYEQLRKTTIETDLKEIDGSLKAPSDTPITEKTVIINKDNISESAYCEKDGATRIVAVEQAPKDDPFACRVVYQEESDLTTPWLAHNESSFCHSKAVSLLDKFVSNGWQCFANTSLTSRQ